MSQKIGVFCSKYCKPVQNLDYDIGFEEKRQ
jgi:hypothetical protein